MPNTRRGRTGRGWDAAPPGVGDASAEQSASDPDFGTAVEDSDLDEDGWPRGSVPASRGRGSPSRAYGARRRSARGDDETRPGQESAKGQPEQDPAERAREICLRLLAVRPRTRAELAGALRQRGISADVAAEVLQRYGEVGIIDDTAFARAWVSSRHHSRGLAKRALASELRQRGVDDDAVGAALADLDPETEAGTARALVERKLRSTRASSPDALMRRLVGTLARKGYPAGLALRVVREVLADRAEDVDATGADLDEWAATLDPNPD